MRLLKVTGAVSVALLLVGVVFAIDVLRQISDRLHDRLDI